MKFGFHDRSTVSFAPMQDSVNDNFFGFDFKKHTVIAHAQSVARLELDESFDVAAQIVAQQPEFLDDSFLLASLETSQILFSAGLSSTR
jgi:hypothetical protein